LRLALTLRQLISNIPFLVGYMVQHWFPVLFF
jgi:hypothetical protein